MITSESHFELSAIATPFSLHNRQKKIRSLRSTSLDDGNRYSIHLGNAPQRNYINSRDNPATKYL